MLCLWWDQDGIIYQELLKAGETVTSDRYQSQIINLERAYREKRPQHARRHERQLLLHDNAPSHTTKRVKETIKEMEWELLPHPPYSQDLAPSDYHLFAAMGHALSDQRLTDPAEVENWLENWYVSKPRDFFWRGIHALPDRWAKRISNEGKYFE